MLVFCQMTVKVSDFLKMFKCKKLLLVPMFVVQDQIYVEKTVTTGVTGLPKLLESRTNWFITVSPGLCDLQGNGVVLD